MGALDIHNSFTMYYIFCRVGCSFPLIYEPTLLLKQIVGRSVVIHEDANDLGRGVFEDSPTTGHSGDALVAVLLAGPSKCGVIGWAK